ncbi:hypothetical protein [Chryseobacterium mucoviscidosis]|uniref:hypothetical protein n=1 Tax=Chryseobacterium mucoviscidosis TaxID=1945581 RepID=UPI0031CEC348
MRKKVEKDSQNITDLSMGFAFEMANNDVLDELRELIQRDKEFLFKDTDEQLSRIGDYLKLKYGALFRVEDFVNWFYGKLKLKQQGKNLLKITDDDLIGYGAVYMKILDEKFTKINNSDFLKLNYGSDNEKVIELLYEQLYPKYIEVTKEDFILHFNSASSSLITWKGTETQFVNLFTSLKFQNDDLIKDLSKHFRNSKGKLFKPEQLSVSKSKSTYTDYNGKKTNQKIIDSIKKLIENN